jgi:hypothetical protein
MVVSVSGDKSHFGIGEGFDAEYCPIVVIGPYPVVWLSSREVNGLRKVSRDCAYRSELSRRQQTESQPLTPGSMFCFKNKPLGWKHVGRRVTVVSHVGQKEESLLSFCGGYASKAESKYHGDAERY